MQSRDASAEIKARCGKCTTCLLTKCNRVCGNFGRCYTICPFLKSVKLTPKEIANNLDPNNPDDIPKIYSCMQCGLCEQKICPQCLSPTEMILKLRESAVDQNKGPMQYHRFQFTNEKNNFFSIYKEEFGGIEQPSLEGKYEYVFFPGCALSAFAPGLVKATEDLLVSKLGKVGLLLDCCYQPLRNIGLKTKFNESMSQLKSKLKEIGNPKLIVSCPNCYRIFEKNIGKDSVLSVYDVLKDQPMKFKPSGNIAIHDSCPYRYYPKELAIIRKIFTSNGINPIELTYNKEYTMCCGAGGGVSYANSELSAKMSEDILADAKQKGADVLVAYCSSCINQFSAGSEKYGIKLYHLLDLITGAQTDYQKISQNIQELFTEPKWSIMLSKMGLSQ